MTTLQQEIASREITLSPGWQEPCQGSVHHSPTPLMTQCYDLAEFAGVHQEARDPILVPKDAGEPVHLCGVCVDNLMIYIFMSSCSDFPWETQRRFGNKIRDLGHRALVHQETTG